jgi:isochorismate synthase
VGEALERIDAGDLDKVVLSRQVTVAVDHGFSTAEVVARLVAAQPGCYVFAAGGFVGATPEMLVARLGDSVRSRPMAGTVARNDDRALSWLAGSGKNRWEHELVVDAVVGGLARWCDEPPRASEPHPEPFADLAHIVTDVVGRLSAPAPSALTLALDLHPTPAVAGAPTEAALALISTLEPAPRGCYGGPVGWVDANGDGEFAVALRCAEVTADRARLYAGAGIVAGSRWKDEWCETETKLGPMRRALTGG